MRLLLVRLFALALFAVVFLPACASTDAEILPIRTYTTADGLVRDDVNQILQDSRGFLWFCTEEGLSRFDGYKFVNYTTDQGLPHRRVTAMLETRAGDYWIATGDGICSFSPRPGKTLFSVVWPDDDRQSRLVNALAEGPAGAIWCATNNGLYLMSRDNGRSEFEFINIEPASPRGSYYIGCLLSCSDGSLWIGTSHGLFWRRSDGSLQRYTSEQGLPSDFIQSLLEDSRGRIWVGTRYGGLSVIERTGNIARVVGTYTDRDGLPSNWIGALFESTEKKIWVGTTLGLSELIEEANGTVQFRSITAAQGLKDPGITAIAQDHNGSLWLGTDNGGAARLAANGFTAYRDTDGLASNKIVSIFEDKSGRVCVITAGNPIRAINEFDGRRFTSLPLTQIRQFGWGWGQIGFQDHEGDWWIDSASGLYRFPVVSDVKSLKGLRPKTIYEPASGLGGEEVFRLFEDSRGDLWISTFGSPDHVLTRWDRAGARMQGYPEWRDIRMDVPTAFCEDKAGDVWIASYWGGLARYSSGHFGVLSEADGLPSGTIHALYVDNRGRVWLGCSNGLGCIDQPTSASPRVNLYTTSQGLSGNDIWCITEDSWGRIYAGTGRGVDRLDPDSGRVRHYTSADGLASGKVDNSLRDHTGALWFSTAEGLSRFVPEPDKPNSPPPITISHLSIAGQSFKISELGETEIPKFEVQSNQNDVQIEFVALSFGVGDVLRYQYQLEGTGQDWCAPTDQRTVSFASLKPGAYRFLVRAIDADGGVSVPATVAFTVLAPVWQRWWFVTLASLTIAFLAYGAYRYRLVKLLELERVRTRIAMDLHDDIGSNLSRVAILSEVVKQAGPSSERSMSMLTEIADSARGLVDSMGDIVWAIDPRRDELSNLIVRVRRFASDVLEPRHIAFKLDVHADFENVKLKADQRRDLFLILKEAISNIARHSESRTASLAIRADRRELTAEISDDGCGFDPPKPGELGPGVSGGHGIANMTARASKLGGALVVESSPGSNTRLRLIIPLKRTNA